MVVRVQIVQINAMGALTKLKVMTYKQGRNHEFPVALPVVVVVVVALVVHVVQQQHGGQHQRLLLWRHALADCIKVQTVRSTIEHVSINVVPL